MSELTQEQIRRFVDEEVVPRADDHDREERVSPEFIAKLSQAGLLGATVPESYGGGGMDWSGFGLLCCELGKACTAVRNLVTVQHMVTQVLERWGSDDQKEKWLRPLAAGEKIAAFALTEPEFGSDAGGIQTAVTQQGNAYTVTGSKKWISFGQVADLFLTLGQKDGKPCCLLVERETSGLTIAPMSGILGAKGSMLAELTFDECSVSEANLIGTSGIGLHPVTFAALDAGRYSIAWGCVGMAEACLEASVTYAKSREQFGRPIMEHQLIQKLITDMIVDIKAARLLCEQAGKLKESNDRRAMRELLVAKYYAASMAIRVTGKAVELHGANGYSREHIVERFFRDAKIMETIEGSNQMMQIMIAKYGYKNYFDEG